MTKIEDTMDAILDVLIEEGEWTGPWAQVLSTLSQRVYGDHVGVGSNEYHQVSMAVLRLEKIGLVQVDRAYRDEARKANVIQRISLA